MLCIVCLTNTCESNAFSRAASSGVDRSAVDAHPDVRAAVTAVEERLGATGRVLLRPSGTEPIVRVMVEAPTLDEATAAAEAIAAVVRANLAL